MGRKLSVETHQDRHKIETRIIEGDSLRDIAGQFGVSKSALQRYVTTRFVELAAKAIEERDLDHGDRILERVERVLVKTEKLVDAADEWLTDPNDPTKYDLSPRSDEVTVIHTTVDKEGNYTREKQALDDYIEEGRGNKKIDKIEWKTVDIRTLLPRAADSIVKQLTLVAQILGKVKQGDTYNFIQVIEEAHKERISSECKNE
jgi:predicted transcriptional regulator